LPTQVYPEPDSETRNPADGFAITLIHGAGGSARCGTALGSGAPFRRTLLRFVLRIVTWYSRPSDVKPPTPFQNCRSLADRGSSDVHDADPCAGTSAGGCAGRRSTPSSWLASRPWAPSSTTRAAAWSSTLSSSATAVALRTNTPPGLSTRSWASLERISS